jgi:uncharacterized protein
MKPTFRFSGWLLNLSSMFALAFLIGCATTTEQCCWPPQRQPVYSEISPRARRGDPDAQNDMGLILLQAKNPDRDGARKWFQSAADKGYAPAQHNIAVMYWKGEARGTFDCPSEAQALKWFMRAAEQDYPPSMTSIGLAYKTGRGVTQSSRDAVYWFRRAAAYNDAEAQYHLGVYYDAGREAQANRPEAYKWFILSAAQGHCLAIKARDNIVGKLSREQIRGAQESAAAWVPKTNSGGGQ